MIFLICIKVVFLIVRWLILFAHNIFYPQHYLCIKTIVDLHCFSFNNLLNSTFLCELLIIIGIILDHFDQLSRSDQIIQNNNFLRDSGDLFFRIIHLNNLFPEGVVERNDHFVGRVTGNVTGFAPVLV